MRVLVLGASGMLGSMVFRVLSEVKDWHVYGTIRSDSLKRFFSPDISGRLLSGIDIEQNDSLIQTFNRIRPNVVINCVGLVKQLSNANNPLQAIPINALLPHRVAMLCELISARMVHISTDCVFSGEKGGYDETSPSDAKDLYGKSKFLGEVDYPHTITLRTSIIGHELQGTKNSLLEWFLSQQVECKGFRKAIFSGLPTVALAQVIRDVVIPRTDLFGLFHIASEPINKFDLLHLIAEAYDKNINIVPNDELVIDRSLNAKRFEAKANYVSKSWPELIHLMHSYK